jgi:hypothetical protein
MNSVLHNIFRQLSLANLAFELLEIVAKSATDNFSLNLRFEPLSQTGEMDILT